MAHRTTTNNSKERILGENVIYSGEIRIKDYNPDGYGKAKYSNGDEFCGTFSKGDPVEGVYTFSNGSYCTIKYKYNFARTKYTKYYITSHGYGFRKAKFETRDTFSNGYYKGEIKNGKRDGVGTYVWNDGASYSGGWLNNCKHGVGKYTYSDGDYDWSVWDMGKEVCVLSRYRKQAQTERAYSYDSYDNSDYSDNGSTSEEVYSTADRLFDEALYEINHGSCEDALFALKRLRSFCDADDYYFEDEMGHRINVDEQIEEIEDIIDEDE